MFDTKICTFLVEAYRGTGNALVEQIILRSSVMKSPKALEHVLIAVPIILLLAERDRGRFLREVCECAMDYLASVAYILYSFVESEAGSKGPHAN